MSNSLEKVVALLLKESHDDYVGVWQIFHHLAREGGGPAADTDAALVVAEKLLHNENVVIGQFRDLVFEPWIGTVQQNLNRLRDELSRLGRTPTIGEVGWFARK